MKFKLFLTLLVFAFATTQAYSQTQASDSTDRKFFVGSTLFMLGNFIPDDPNSPDFVQLNFGYSSNIMGQIVGI